MGAASSAPHRWRSPLLACALLLAWGAGLASGCGESDAERTSRRSSDRPPSGAEGRNAESDRETRAPDPRLPPASLGALTGSTTLDDRAAVEGEPVERDVVVAVEPGGRAELELSGGARATILEGGAVLLAREPDRGLWIARGLVHVADPPSGLGQRSPRRIATASATIDLAGSGDVVVAVDASGVTHVAVIAGAAEILTGEVDARRRLRSVHLDAGQSARVVDRLEEPTLAAGSRLEEALAEARAFLAASSAPAATPGPSPVSLGTATSRLDEAMRWLEIEEHRGRELTTRHRAAVQAGRSEEAMLRQREIVAHAQTVHGLRQVVLARWERFALTARAATAPRALQATLAPRYERLRNLLGS